MRVKITLACQDCKQRKYNMTKDKKTHPDRMETKKYLSLIHIQMCIRDRDKDVTELAPYNRDVNTVFQSYALFPHMTVFDNIASVSYTHLDVYKRQAQDTEDLHETEAESDSQEEM